ncbi:unnamed protein product [Moneuplotes crassus]|uniref:Uncharacterized protein n=1 Tax=Euplotes crassus TaxID=5936 RepID=A0AAD1UGC4_EUPCR|nr:unnamed protein product [Moneuplotes crassus]
MNLCSTSSTQQSSNTAKNMNFLLMETGSQIYKKWRQQERLIRLLLVKEKALLKKRIMEILKKSHVTGGFGDSGSRFDKKSYKKNDRVGAGYSKGSSLGTTKKAYNPYHADGNILDKYRNPSKRSPEQKPKAKRPTKKKEILDDSWEKAMNDDAKYNDDDFSTYKNPAPIVNTKPAENLIEDNFNFNDMKQSLPKEEVHKFDEESSGDEAEKNYDYNFVEDPNAYATANINQNHLSKQINQTAVNNQEEEDFFGSGGVSNQPNLGMQKINSAQLDDIFGESSANQQHTSEVPPQNDSDVNDFFGQDNTTSQPAQDDIFGGGKQSQNQYYTEHVGGETDMSYGASKQNKTENIFASDPSSIFNTGAPAMGQGYNTMGGGYNQNQYYHNYQGNGMQTQSNYNGGEYGDQTAYQGYNNHNTYGYNNQNTYGNQYQTGYDNMGGSKPQSQTPQYQTQSQSNGQGLDDLFS